MHSITYDSDQSLMLEESLSAGVRREPFGGRVLGSEQDLARSSSGTYRATFGGALASRELWFGRSGSDRYLYLLCGLVTRVSGRISFGASCPKWSLAREASTLSLATCHAGFSRRGIDPVGETSNVPDTPLGSRRLPRTRTFWRSSGSLRKRCELAGCGCGLTV